MAELKSDGWHRYFVKTPCDGSHVLIYVNEIVAKCRCCRSVNVSGMSCSRFCFCRQPLSVWHLYVWWMRPCGCPQSSGLPADLRQAVSRYAVNCLPKDKLLHCKRRHIAL